MYEVTSQLKNNTYVRFGNYASAQKAVWVNDAGPDWIQIGSCGVITKSPNYTNGHWRVTPDKTRLSIQNWPVIPNKQIQTGLGGRFGIVVGVVIAPMNQFVRVVTDVPGKNQEIVTYPRLTGDPRLPPGHSYIIQAVSLQGAYELYCLTPHRFIVPVQDLPVRAVRKCRYKNCPVHGAGRYTGTRCPMGSEN